MPSGPLDEAIERLRGLAGGDTAVGSWDHMDQAVVDSFAKLTGEDGWIHTDPARAAASPFRGTIVQGSLLMARFGRWLRDSPFWLPEPAVPLNYGFDRVRLPRGLPTGAAVRFRGQLRRLEERAPMVRLYLDAQAERDDDGSPVVVAEWIVAFLLPA